MRVCFFKNISEGGVLFYFDYFGVIVIDNVHKFVPKAGFIRYNQDLKVFVLDGTGAWLYNAKANQLEKVSNKNMLPYLAEKQDFILNAPVHLVYTSSDKKWGFAHAGSAYQNVYLFATAQGLSTVIRGLPNDAEMAKALNLAPDEFTIAHQPIGYSK